MALPQRQPYSGVKRKLVLAIDVGTTYSGVSYSILDPGSVPEIKSVTKYPGQDQITTSSLKIPSIMYYDQGGHMRAAGAEAVQQGVSEMAEDESWSKVEWFKMHLRPRTAGSATSAGLASRDLLPLPPGKGITRVLADFMSYLLCCARTYITESHINGPNLWASVEKDIDFVLSHPNGWEGYQQEMMRKAAVMAGLITDDGAGHARVTFVTEGEASLHFAMQNGLPKATMEGEHGVIIVDAGGGTIDISSYGEGRRKGSTQTFTEVNIPQCHFYGSIFVNVLAKRFLQKTLAGSPFLEDLKHIVECFDKTTKLCFRNKAKPQYIKFGSLRDNDQVVGIRHGQLKLDGNDVAQFFEPSIEQILSAVRGMQGGTKTELKTIVLVGGFAASDWLYSQVSEALKEEGCSVFRPDSYVNKAVADGALSFYLDHHVTARIAHMTYGTECAREYSPHNPEHLKRAHLKYRDAEGSVKLGGTFSVIVPYGSQIDEGTEFKDRYWRAFKTLEEIGEVSDPLLCYRGEMKDGVFMDAYPDSYKTLCTIEADISRFTPEQKPVINQPGKLYYRVPYDIIVVFGGTELKAHYAWKDTKGVERRTPGKVVYIDESQG